MSSGQYPLERFMAFDSIYSFAPHPSGDSVAVGINTSGQVNVWLYSLKGLPRRLTPFTERRAVPVSWDLSGLKLLFTTDYQGDEAWQLHLYEEGSGWFKDLVFEEGVTHVVSRRCWSPNGELAFMANREDRGRFDLYIHDPVTGREVFVVKGFGGYQKPVWFSNALLLEDLRAHEDTTIYVVDVKRGSVTELTPHRGEAVFDPIGEWGNGFFMLTDEGLEHATLAYYDLGSRSYRVVWRGEWGVEAADVGRDYLLFSVNVEGYSKLYALSLEVFRVREVWSPGGVVYGIAAARGRDVFYVLLTKPSRPMDIYRVDLEGGGVVRVTDTFYGRVPDEVLVRPESVWYESFDGRKIHAFIYRPRSEGRVPVLVVLHGGPESQSRPYYSALTQYLVSRGVAVCYPNFRGSSGYGKSFQKLIRRDWGGGELRDVEHLVKYLLSQPWVDPGRLGVFGGASGAS